MLKRTDWFPPAPVSPSAKRIGNEDGRGYFEQARVKRSGIAVGHRTCCAASPRNFSCLQGAWVDILDMDNLAKRDPGGITIILSFFQSRNYSQFARLLPDLADLRCSERDLPYFIYARRHKPICDFLDSLEIVQANAKGDGCLVSNKFPAAVLHLLFPRQRHSGRAEVGHFCASKIILNSVCSFSRFGKSVGRLRLYAPDRGLNRCEVRLGPLHGRAEYRNAKRVGNSLLCVEHFSP